ncbi:hypothetical protein FOB58_002439 [Candida parapsilosis]|uniref:Uncharacterized protein n=1 Tax=Candida parapsilosis TaxID=5480 RepID=A0A8X7TCV6_CANPA|nr:hypothetical protein FOB59_005343 [Candida parapsilosis]KAF6049162.1 hypothetical protein FOB58_002439 [Candida parapsilosis]KAF6057013.1 hypothetical protein FOB60_001568 [Candida parapsilosis]KAF6066268.1 hypothetical protein FOB61_002338 [Candida parapsilosis]
MTNPLAQPVLNPLRSHLLPEQSPSFDSLSPSSLQSPFKTNYGPGAQTLRGHESTKNNTVGVTSQATGAGHRSGPKQVRSLFGEIETSPAKKQKLIEVLDCELGKGKLIDEFLVFEDYTQEPTEMKQMEEEWAQKLKKREREKD